MKRLKKFAALLATVAICALVPGANVLTVSAAEPVTYQVQYVAEDNAWRFQVGGRWDDEGSARELYYMYNDFKDGDIVVVDTNGYDNTEPLAFSKHISNLTVINGSKVVISAPSYGDVFVLLDSAAAVTGNVANAYIYDNATASFHSNVDTLTLIDTESQSTGHATVDGTTGHVLRKTETGYIYFEAYNVAAGKLVVEWGKLETSSADYSTTPTATQAPVQTPAASTQKPVTSNDYDDVPKTGESNTVLILTGIAVLCLLGKRVLKNV